MPTHKALRHESHSFTCKLQFYVCLSLVSIQLRQQTSNCSLLLIYRPRKDERLSWPGWQWSRPLGKRRFSFVRFSLILDGLNVSKGNELSGRYVKCFAPSSCTITVLLPFLDFRIIMFIVKLLQQVNQASKWPVSNVGYSLKRRSLQALL